MQGKALDVMLDNNLVKIPVPTCVLPVVQDTDNELGYYSRFSSQHDGLYCTGRSNRRQGYKPMLKTHPFICWTEFILFQVSNRVRELYD